MSELPSLTIAGRRIGSIDPPYIIAELSGNHNGDLNRAMRLLEVAADCGVDAVKLQTYTADTITIDHGGPEFVINNGLWRGRQLYDLYQEASTPWEWHEALFARGRELGVAVFSSPFDPSAVIFLERLGTPAFKIASFEIVDLPLIRLAAATGKPIIMSTGIANLSEIDEAVGAARAVGDGGLALLHCVSAYPTPFEDSNLRTIPHLSEAFGVTAGLSDHTMSTAAAVAAVALGARVIEKHFTLARADGGPDSSFSLEPNELKRLVEDCRDAWSALGRVHYDLKGSEQQSRVFRRSLYVVADVAAGEEMTRHNVRSIRPGFGLAPKYLPDVVGRRAARGLRRGEPLAWDMLANA
ncbi:MAG: pseudaminic acid synthase [Caldilineaceae bacterium]|nr:pseudaminic acid synthase [Caldilineaceae bacterium]